ncbi:MAG: GNAT family N-acetyltransferase [Candidatus Zixiibacteriota bacterium]
MKKSKLVVRAATEDDYPQIAHLLDDTFSPIPFEKRRKLWQWRYDDNPARVPEIPPFIVGDQDGKIVGVHGLTPLRVKIKNEVFYSGCSCDLAVDPAARSAGMKIKVRAMKNETSLLPMSTSANEAANKITLALGGKELSPARNKYIKALKYSGLVARKFGGFAGVLAKPLDAILGSKAKQPVLGGSLRLEDITEFDTRFDQFWNIISQERHNLFVRDAAYLNWRYCRYPFPGIEAFAIIEDKTVRGLAAIHKSIDNDKLPFIAILELLTQHNDSRTAQQLLDEILSRASKHGVDTIIAKTMSDDIDGLLVKTGFKPRPLAISPYTYKNNTELPDEQFDTMGNWYIALGDGDACYYYE